MAILGIKTDLIGQQGIVPRVVNISCNDDLGFVISNNFLSPLFNQGYSFYPTDIFYVSYLVNYSGKYTTSFFNPVFSGSSHNSGISLSLSSDRYINFRTAVNFSQLASGGTVQLLPGNISQLRFKLVVLSMNSGTNTQFVNFANGDRLVQITDGATAQYTLITAAFMQAMVNTRWGNPAQLPFPTSTSGTLINQSTALGKGLIVSYSGGTTDYTAGSAIFSGTVQQLTYIDPKTETI